MALEWYLTFLLVAGCVALADQLLRLRFTRASYLVSLVLALLGGILGASLGSILGLPEVLQLTVRGQVFPIFWALMGGAVFVLTLDFVDARRGRRARLVRA